MAFPMSDVVEDVQNEAGSNSEDAEFVSRLRLAVQKAGGLNQAARASGIKVRTLSRYLQGYEIRRNALISIAKAAGVSVQWLTVGFDLQPDVGVAAGPAMPLHPAEPPEPVKLMRVVNADLLAAALEGSENALINAGADPRNWHARAQLVCLLYDAAMSKLHQV